MSKKDDEKEDQGQKKKQGEDSKITKTSEDKEKDFKAPGIEGTKETKDEGVETVEEENARLKAENDELKAKLPKEEKKEAVTIDDVLPGLREKGYKI